MAIAVADTHNFKGPIIATDDGNVFLLDVAGRNAASNYARQNKVGAYLIDNRDEEVTCKLIAAKEINEIPTVAAYNVLDSADSHDNNDAKQDEGEADGETLSDDDRKTVLDLVSTASQAELDELKQEYQDEQILAAIADRENALKAS